LLPRQSATYVKLNDGTSLSVSNFDVAGETLQKGLKGYIYGEAYGVQRYLSFILNDAANKLPRSHPVRVKHSLMEKLVYQSSKV
jgi:hypothetical protein